MGDNPLPERSETRISTGTDRKVHDYPRPTVAVDIALLTWDPERGLLVAEMERADGRWALPGTFLRARETLALAVERCLRDKVGVEGIRTRQLCVLDDPDRDDRDWVLSVAHVVAVRPDQLRTLGSGSAERTRLVPADRPGELAWDHNEIVRLAKNDLRARYLSGADPDRLLGKNRFTLRELRMVHEAVAGEGLQRDAFRRAMEPYVEGTEELADTGSRGRPAELFRRRS